jgi:hypothetical protein
MILRTTLIPQQRLTISMKRIVLFPWEIIDKAKIFKNIWYLSPYFINATLKGVVPGRFHSPD